MIVTQTGYRAYDPTSHRCPFAGCRYGKESMERCKRNCRNSPLHTEPLTDRPPCLGVDYVAGLVSHIKSMHGSFELFGREVKGLFHPATNDDIDALGKVKEACPMAPERLGEQQRGRREAPAARRPNQDDSRYPAVTAGPSHGPAVSRSSSATGSESEAEQSYTPVPDTQARSRYCVWSVLTLLSHNWETKANRMLCFSQWTGPAWRQSSQG